MTNDQYKIDVVFEVRSDAEESRQSDVTNYVPELGQAIISADGAKYFKNFIWVPLKHDFRFVVNAELLPYKYQIENVELPTSDDARMENTRIRVPLVRTKLGASTSSAPRVTIPSIRRLCTILKVKRPRIFWKTLAGVIFKIRSRVQMARL